MSTKALEAAARRLTQQWPDRFADHRLPCRKNGCRECEAIFDLAACMEEYAREVAMEAFLECADVAGGNESDEYYRKHAEEWWEGRK